MPVYSYDVSLCLALNSKVVPKRLTIPTALFHCCPDFPRPSQGQRIRDDISDYHTASAFDCLNGCGVGEMLREG